ncbi:hypothetical protein FDP41_003098 [Naegleria fowleri]|uniref:START domain-containing protein n=1 Tax=Naegleria fowleri TaxID=5763 RepID=A0A6A5BRK9_NAEFO|nr:uncharacterized protein FDP41_003098 [Naegleria fowleri]KAF0977776.1 hypothetical protein FDP41_003098 [Naegleria fowleri]
MSQQPSHLSDFQKSQIKTKWNEAFSMACYMTSSEALQDDHHTFTYHGTKEEIDIYYKKTDTTTIIRGDTICEQIQPDAFLEAFVSLDLKVKHELDSNSKRIEVIEKWEDEDGVWKLMYYVISAGAFVSDRDFIYVTKTFKKDNVTYFASTSCHDLVELPSHMTPQKGAVRATNVFVCMRMEELENGDLYVTYATQADPNGWIPHSIVNAVIYSVPLTLAKNAKFQKRKLRRVPNSPSHH